MNSTLFSRTVFERNGNLMTRLKNRRRLMMAIKEEDGQFVLRDVLRDGHGPPTSSHEMMHLTLETVSCTLMMIDMIK